ncbi:PHP domain-containing protein [bacterium]|nr:PHP domain-containing protein [bacterium]
MKVDFHIHSNFSDGQYSPEKLVDMAIDAGLGIISITDHDNVLSYNVAKKYIEDTNKDLTLVQGIEVNTMYKDEEIHILGYMPNVENSEFKNLLKVQQEARIEQAKEIIDLLAKREKIYVKFEDLQALVAEGGSIGRPHIAKAITSAGGTKSVVEAYDKYINDNSPVYVKRKTVSPHDAVEIIYDAGGVPVIAHPYNLTNSQELIKQLMQYGLRGIEAYHRRHTPAIVEYFSTMAEEFGLIVTGGSDFHSPNISTGQIVLGKNFVPEWTYEKLLDEKKRLDMAQ